jgi:shikimate kinase
MESLLKGSLQGLTVYLVGMMGVGKTTVGELLAQELGYQFFDTDTLITQVSKKSISDIFAEEGEEVFRSIESRVLGEISSYTRLVVATGGGIVMARQNWSYLQQGLVIWLDAPISLLMERLQSDRTRPLLQTPNPEQRLQEIFQQRQVMYAQADLKVSLTDAQTPDIITAKIVELIPTVLRKTNDEINNKFPENLLN